MPSSLLIRNIHTLVLMDAENQVLRGAHLYVENGEIRRVGSGSAHLPKADRVIDGRHCIALPGLVNTHHHLYQTLTRAYAPAADAARARSASATPPLLAPCSAQIRPPPRPGPCRRS